jgi:hypothetical protein
LRGLPTYVFSGTWRRKRSVEVIRIQSRRRTSVHPATLGKRGIGGAPEAVCRRAALPDGGRRNPRRARPRPAGEPPPRRRHRQPRPSGGGLTVSGSAEQPGRVATNCGRRGLPRTPLTHRKAQPPSSSLRTNTKRFPAGKAARSAKFLGDHAGRKKSARAALPGRFRSIPPPEGR